MHLIISSKYILLKAVTTRKKYINTLKKNTIRYVKIMYNIYLSIIQVCFINY